MLSIHLSPWRTRTATLVVGLSLALSVSYTAPARVSAAPTSRATSSRVTAAPTDPVAATLVQVIDTSAWTPASPDPSGIAYLGATRDTLLVSDSEVDETTGTTYQDVNLWEITRTGTVVQTGTTWQVGGVGGYTAEPTGVGYDVATGRAFISSDIPNRVFVRQAGPDTVFGTADDVDLGAVNTANMGIHDTEDPDLAGSGDLFFLDGEQATIFRVDPVNAVFGDGNDTFTSYDISGLGAQSFEALAYDPVRHTIVVGGSNDVLYELTEDAILVRTIDVNPIPVDPDERLSGLAIAPSSTGSGAMTYWIVDRGIDNDDDATENDGRIIEVAAPSGNTAPVVTSVEIAPADPDTDGTVTATASGFDPDGDTVTFTYQWLKNGSPIGGQTGASLNLATPGNGDPGDTISVRVTAHDASAASEPVDSAEVTVTGGANTAPTLAAVATQFDAVNDVVSLDVNADDPDGDTLTFSAEGLPTGLSINASSGLVSGTVTEQGVFDVTFGVTDGTEQDTQDVSWFVGDDFSDVAASKLLDDILWLSAMDITTGCSATKYCPTGAVTRDQMASFLARWLNLPAASKDYFTDDNTNFHQDNINRVAEAGITLGCGNNHYCPTQGVTRAEMASFLARALDLPAASGDYFTDDNGNLHEANINRVAEANITNGCGGGLYCPNRVVTREEMAAFIHRGSE